MGRIEHFKSSLQRAAGRGGDEAGKKQRKREQENKEFFPPSLALFTHSKPTRKKKKKKKKRLSYRAVLKQPVEHGAVRLPDASQVEPPHLRQELVLVVRRDRLQKLDVVVGVKLLDLRLRPRLGPVEHHRLLEVVVGHEGVGEADAVGPHGVASAVVERACARKLVRVFFFFFFFFRRRKRKKKRLKGVRRPGRRKIQG